MNDDKKSRDQLINELEALRQKVQKLEAAEDEWYQKKTDYQKIEAVQSHLLEAERDQRALAEALRETGISLSATLDFDTVIDRLLAQIGSVIAYDAANVMLVKDGWACIARMTGYEQFGEEAVRQTANLSFDIQTTANLSRMVSTRQPMVIPDVAEYDWKQGGGSRYIRSWAGAPIIVGGDIIAFLNLDKIEPNFYQPKDAQRLSAFAAQAAIAIENTRLHQETQRQARQVQQILDTVQQGIVLLDADYFVKLANPAGRQILKEASRVTEGQKLIYLGKQPLGTFLVPPIEGMWHTLHLADSLFEITTQPIISGSTTEGWVMLLRDATEERAIEQRIRQQERLAAIGHLASGIAHDFNNILTSIIGYADLLQYKADTPASAKKQLGNIVSQGRRAADLIRQILDFSRQTAAQKKRVHLVEFVQKTIALLRRTFPENIRIEFNPGPIPQSYKLNIDPAQIRQVLTNLALNARDAMPSGGILQFDLETINVQDDDLLPHAELTPGEWVALIVTDSGIGIRPEIMPHIFEPFFTTKDVGKGTGLGLAQVHGIIHQHSGLINVNSNVGNGTTVTIYLPAQSTQAKEVEPTKILRGNNECVLLVEDEATVLEVAEAMLEYLGYRVLTAQDGYEALRVFEQYESEIDLVLTDLTMPNLDGDALVQMLQSRRPGSKIILLSGYPLETTSRRLQSQGIAGYLQKPLKIEQLAQVVHQTLKAAPFE